MSKWKELKDRNFANLDCGDSSCRYTKNRTGMRTNGGCRCIDLYGTPYRSTPHGETRYLANLLGEAYDYIAELENFVKGIDTGWDCDTGANGTHPHYCRVCTAKALLEKQ